MRAASVWKYAQYRHRVAPETASPIISLYLFGIAVSSASSSVLKLAHSVGSRRSGTRLRNSGTSPSVSSMSRSMSRRSSRIIWTSCAGCRPRPGARQTDWTPVRGAVKPPSAPRQAPLREDPRWRGGRCSRHPRRMTTHTPPRPAASPDAVHLRQGPRRRRRRPGRAPSLDPNVVRVAFAVSTLFGGAGVVAYVVLWAFAPTDVDGRRAPGGHPDHRMSAVHDDGGRGPARHDPHQPLLREGALGARARRRPLPRGAPRPGHPHARRPPRRRRHRAGARHRRRRPRGVRRDPGLGRRAHAGAGAPLSRGPRERAEVEALSRRFDEQLGPRGRRLLYVHMLAQPRAHAALQQPGRPGLEDRAIRAGWPLAVRFAGARLGIRPGVEVGDEAAVWRSSTRRRSCSPTAARTSAETGSPRPT